MSSDEESPEQPRPTRRRSRWLLSEDRRTAIASVPAIGLAVTAISFPEVMPGSMDAIATADPFGYAMLCTVVAWTLLAVIQVVLTLITYRGLSGDEFEYAIHADATWQKWLASSPSKRLRLQLLGSGPVSWSVSISVAALFVVVALVLRPSLREIPMALAFAVVMVVASWVGVSVVYAVRYARVGAAALDFPGDGPKGFSDYLYLAIMVQTSFGTADVDVRTSELRRIVTGHSLIAFAFNSVILATIVSLLLGIA